MFILVSFDEFAKIGLRAGTVQACEKVEGSDKLYKLAVNLGSEVRTIVSGIAQFYSTDELVGKKIIVVANLEPKTIRGIESHGMLLAAEDGKGNLTLATLDDAHFEDGSQVH